jgi:3'-phosphoadenosine 5'-phosphosulfate (PAPS) 3'-phosphatase
MFFHLLKRVNNYVRKIDKGEIKIDIYAKGSNDSFTTADYVIQKMFELHLEKYYPNIKIIGEEDTTNDLIKECELYSIDPLQDINMNLFPEELFPEEIKNLNVDDLVFFVDPIDSTSSFIKKNYKPSTVMIGLTLKEEPLIGILHYFFWEGKNNCTKTVFNIPKKGVFEYNLDYDSMEEFKLKKNENELIILTSKFRTIPETAKCKF